MENLKFFPFLTHTAGIVDRTVILGKDRPFEPKRQTGLFVAIFTKGR